jgi:hypothetical protein
MYRYFFVLLRLCVFSVRFTATLSTWRNKSSLYILYIKRQCSEAGVRRLVPRCVRSTPLRAAAATSTHVLHSHRHPALPHHCATVVVLTRPVKLHTCATEPTSLYNGCSSKQDWGGASCDVALPTSCSCGCRTRELHTPPPSSVTTSLHSSK